MTVYPAARDGKHDEDPGRGQRGDILPAGDDG